jgi:hypothetical protein
MQYFDTLPKLIKIDNNGNALVLTNLLARASILKTFFDNPVVYYNYDLQEGDTPEIIAHKYYGDVYRYWIVLYTNTIIDPQWQWPVNSDVFSKMLVDKYPSINTASTIKKYQKVVTQYDVNTGTTTVNEIVISQNDYESLFETTNTYTLPTGDVIITVAKKALSIYDYELEQNEKNRKIRLLNSIYVNQLEKELQTLMKQ